MAVTGRRLDLDHVRAEIGHHPPGKGPGDQLPELEDAQPRERALRRRAFRCGPVGVHGDRSASAPSLSVRRSRSACAIVLGSTYSSSLPTGTPRASRVTFSPRARISSPM